MLHIDNQEQANINAESSTTENASESKAPDSNISADNPALTVELAKLRDELRDALTAQADAHLALNKHIMNWNMLETAETIHSRASKFSAASKHREAKADFIEAIALSEGIHLYNQAPIFFILADSWANLALIFILSTESNYSPIEPVASIFSKALDYLVKLSDIPEYQLHYKTIIREIFISINYVAKIGDIQLEKGNSSNAESCYKTTLTLLSNLLASLKIESIPEDVRSEILILDKITDDKNNKISKAKEILRLPSSAKLFSGSSSAALSTKAEEPISELNSDQKDIPGLNDANKSKISSSSSAALSGKN